MLLALSDLNDYADIQWQEVLASTRGTSEGLAWYKKQKHRTCTFFPCPYFQKSFDYQMLLDSDSIALGFLVLQLVLVIIVLPWHCLVQLCVNSFVSERLLLKSVSMAIQGS